MGKRKHVLLLFDVLSCCKRRTSNHSTFSLGQRSVRPFHVPSAIALWHWFRQVWQLAQVHPNPGQSRGQQSTWWMSSAEGQQEESGGQSLHICWHQSAGSSNFPLFRRTISVFPHHFFHVTTGFRVFDKSWNALWYYLKVIKLTPVSSKSSYLQTHRANAVLRIPEESYLCGEGLAERVQCNF